MKVRARKWQAPETERLVEANPLYYVPDEYLNLFEMKTGDVVFVEVESTEPTAVDGWELWRVQVLSPGILITCGVSYEAAEQELVLRAVTALQ